MPQARDLLIAAAALVLLPFALTSIGLGVTSATEVVVFAIACMALNILVRYTGLTSFGHGAWFGLAAYAAGLAQLKLFPGSIVLPVMVGLIVVAFASLVFGYVILRRRGVYFSLLTLALAAMLYTVAFRWTELTGGENGLGGITRPLHRLSGQPLQAVGLRGLGDDHRACRHAAAVQQPHDLRRSDLGRVLGRAFGHGHHRRHALVPRPRARRAVFRDLPRLSLRYHRELAAVLRIAVRGLRRALADRTGGAGRDVSTAIQDNAGREGGDGQPPEIGRASCRERV